MDFFTQSQKIVKCSICGKEFLTIGDINTDETYFCSAECSERFGEKRR